MENNWLILQTPYLINTDDEIDQGESSDEDISDNEFPGSKPTGKVQKKERGFSFDFDDGEVRFLWFCLSYIQWDILDGNWSLARLSITSYKGCL